jgi:hypothetical protein
MGVTVTTADFRIKGKSLSRDNLTKIAQILGIDRSDKLPTGAKYKYVLMLEAETRVPGGRKTASRKNRI